MRWLLILWLGVWLWLPSAHAQSLLLNLDEDMISKPKITPRPPAPLAPPPAPPKPKELPTAIQAPRIAVPSKPTMPAPREPEVAPASDRVTEANLVRDCPSCKVNKNMADLQALVNGKLRLGDLTSWRKSRGLVQIPTEGPKHFEGPCGSTHYNPMSPGPDRQGFPTDNYASPLAACVMMSLLQDWKRTECPDTSKGCRVMWGDISHQTQRTKNRIWVHSTHTDGECIDFRPMRKGRPQIANGLSYESPDYNLEATRKFIKMAYAKGADLIYFNDRRIPASRAGGHSDHIHICFRGQKNGRSNEQAKNTCRNFKYDAGVCE